jgi:hypothetical protein
MSISRREVLASVLGAGGIAVASEMAADGQGNQNDLEAARQALEPRVLSGSDLGFRIDRIARDGVPVGALVVRVDGKWIAPQFQPALRRAT